MKKRIIAMLAGLFVLTSASFALSPSDFFLNYGGGINEGDSIASVQVALPWNLITTEGGKLPTFIGEYEYALPIGPVPFTMGGYVGGSGEWGSGYGLFTLTAGGSLKYHVAIPPVPGLDLFVGTKLGMKFNIGNLPANYTILGFDWGMDIGASYFFNDSIGITAALGYPAARIGVLFKF